MMVMSGQPLIGKEKKLPPLVTNSKKNTKGSPRGSKETHKSKKASPPRKKEETKQASRPKMKSEAEDCECLQEDKNVTIQPTSSDGHLQKTSSEMLYKLSAGSSSTDLVYLLTCRLCEAETKLQQMEQKLSLSEKSHKRKDVLIKSLEEKFWSSQCDASAECLSVSTSKMAEELIYLRTKCKNLQKQVCEMTEFLADYGLKWIGDNQDSLKTCGSSCEGYIDELNFTRFLSCIEELNELAGCGITKICYTNEGATFKTPDSIPLVLYADGLMLFSGPFRAYTDPGTQLFVRDILDGYFPSELQHSYPEGVCFQVIDKHDTSYECTRSWKPFLGQGHKLGCGEKEAQAIPADCVPCGSGHRQILSKTSSAEGDGQNAPKSVSDGCQPLCNGKLCVGLDVKKIPENCLCSPKASSLFTSCNYEPNGRKKPLPTENLKIIQNKRDKDDKQSESSSDKPNKSLNQALSSMNSCSKLKSTKIQGQKSDISPFASSVTAGDSTVSDNKASSHVTSNISLDLKKKGSERKSLSSVDVSHYEESGLIFGTQNKCRPTAITSRNSFHTAMDQRNSCECPSSKSLDHNFSKPTVEQCSDNISAAFNNTIDRLKNTEKELLSVKVGVESKMPVIEKSPDNRLITNSEDRCLCPVTSKNSVNKPRALESKYTCPVTSKDSLGKERAVKGRYIMCPITSRTLFEKPSDLKCKYKCSSIRSLKNDSNLECGYQDEVTDPKCDPCKISKYCLSRSLSDNIMSDVTIDSEFLEEKAQDRSNASLEEKSTQHSKSTVQFDNQLTMYIASTVEVPVADVLPSVADDDSPAMDKTSSSSAAEKTSGDDKIEYDQSKKINEGPQSSSKLPEVLPNDNGTGGDINDVTSWYKKPIDYISSRHNSFLSEFQDFGDIESVESEENDDENVIQFNLKLQASVNSLELPKYFSLPKSSDEITDIPSSDENETNRRVSVELENIDLSDSPSSELINEDRMSLSPEKSVKRVSINVTKRFSPPTGRRKSRKSILLNPFPITQGQDSKKGGSKNVVVGDSEEKCRSGLGFQETGSMEKIQSGQRWPMTAEEFLKKLPATVVLNGRLIDIHSGVAQIFQEMAPIIKTIHADSTYESGDKITLKVRSEDGHEIYLVHISPDERVEMLYKLLDELRASTPDLMNKNYLVLCGYLPLSPVPLLDRNLTLRDCDLVHNSVLYLRALPGTS